MSHFIKAVNAVSSFGLFNSLLKFCIKSCSGAAVSSLNMPWKSPRINPSETFPLVSLSVIWPLVSKLSLGLIKTLFWLDTCPFFSGLPVYFFLDLATLLRATFLIPTFCETRAVAILSSHFQRTQACFSRLWVWRETVIAWLKNPSALYLGQ